MSDSQTPVSDLYVRLGQLQRENAHLRDVIASKDLDMATLRASLRLRDIEMVNLRNASMNMADGNRHHSASCPGCLLCVSYTPSPVATREDLDTSTDGRTLT